MIFVRELLERERGQALVEMALVLPLLLLLIFGCVEFGRVFGSSLLINNLARDGVRYGVVGHSDAEIQEVIIDNLAWLNEDQMTITINPAAGSREKGDALEVTIDYSVALTAPIISGVVPNPVPLTASYVMRME